LGILTCTQLPLPKKAGNFYPDCRALVSRRTNSNPHLSANLEETGGKFMSELKHEHRKRNEYGCKRQESGYHAVVKGRTDNLDSDELDLYRFMIGGVQGK